MPADKSVSVNGIEMFYHDEGKGQPILFLHGSLATHAVWQAYFDTFSTNFRVIAPDLRGHGNTVSTDSAISATIASEDIAEFIKVLGLKNPILCGWSGGGDTALRIAMTYPDLVGKLIVGGVTLRISDTYQQTLSAMGLESTGKLNVERAMQANPDMIANWKLVHTQSENHWQDLINKIGPEMMNPTKPDLNEIAKIDKSTLILWGDRDQFLRVEDAVELYRLLADAQLAIVPNADHFVTRTHVDYVSKLILDFLNQT